MEHEHEETGTLEKRHEDLTRIYNAIEDLRALLGDAKASTREREDDRALDALVSGVMRKRQELWRESGEG